MSVLPSFLEDGRGQSFNIKMSKKKQLFVTLVRTVRQTLFRTLLVGIGTGVVGFCSRGERLGSTLNTTRKNGNL